MKVYIQLAILYSREGFQYNTRSIVTEYVAKENSVSNNTFLDFNQSFNLQQMNVSFLVFLLLCYLT